MTARRFLIAVLLVASGFAGGLAFLGRMRAEEQAIAQTPAAPRATVPAAPAPAAPIPAGAPSATQPAMLPAMLPDFSAVAERTIPSVVNVSSQQLVRRRVVDPFEQLFGSGRAYEQRALASSLGSGVIVSSDGYILTNNHVVTGDTQAALQDIDITVALSDKQELPARVIGLDRGTDLALLKVDGKNLPVMPWGDSERLKVAEWVLAIGNPYQLSESVTLGIVSAVNRTDEVGINDFGNFIQTDAAINPGNSGGALINARGELVGINTAIFSQSGGYQGIGFAVSSNLARKIMADLQRYGQVRRGDIPGIKIRELTTRLATRLGADSTQGALVNQLDPRSSAGRAGLQLGDVIVSFNDTAVNTPRQLVRLVGEAAIGSTARVTVLRSGRRVELKLPIEQTTQQLPR